MNSELRQHLQKYAANRDALVKESQRRDSLTLGGQEMKFIEAVKIHGEELSAILDFGESPVLWEALSQLVGSHVGELRQRAGEG